MRVSVEDVLSIVEQLDLRLLDTGWVNNMWKKDFACSPEDLPEEFAEEHSLMDPEHIVIALREATKTIHMWLSQDGMTRNSSGATSWQSLEDVPRKPLLALLYFYMTRCSENLRDAALAQLGVRSAQLYLALLAIPGAKAFNILQFPLYEVFLSVFNLKKLLKGKSPAKKGRRNYSVDDEEEEEESSPGETVKMLNELLMDLKKFTKCFSFKTEPDMLKITLECVADLTRMERNATPDEITRCSDENSVTLLTKNAYLTMLDLITEFHGRPAETIRLILFQISRNLSLLGGETHPEMELYSAREQAAVRSMALWFLAHHLVPRALENEAKKYLLVLTQKLCRDVPDKADQRAKATEIIVSVSSLLPPDMYFEALKWIMRESLSNVASQRLVAVDLVSKLIYLKQGSLQRSNMDEASAAEESSHDGTSGLPSVSQHTDGDASSSRVISFSKPVEHVPIEFRRAMLAVIVARLQDPAPSVRTRAVTALSELVSSGNSPTVRSLVAELFITPFEKPGVDVEANENKFLKFQPFTSCLDELDAPEVSKKMLPGGTVIVKQVVLMCAEKVVSVRRAAITLLTQIYKLSQHWLTPAYLKVLFDRCHDDSSMVRKESATTITNLMLMYPEHDSVVNLWVQNILSRVDDGDPTVRKHIIKILTDTIIARIKPLAGTTSDDLPWRLVHRMATLHLRGRLTQLCGLWHSSVPCELTRPRVHAIETHVDGPWGTAACALLASISAVSDIPNPQVLVDTFMNLENLTEENNIRIGMLLLSALSYRWDKLSVESQRGLQRRLLTGLQNSEVAPCAIPLVVTVATATMVTTAEDELEGKKGVAKWAKDAFSASEEHVKQCLGGEHVDAGPCDKCLCILSFMCRLVDLHTDSESIARVYKLVYKFLTTNRGHSKVEKQTHAMGLLLLGHMSLEDYNLACDTFSLLGAILTQRSDPVLLVNAVNIIRDIGKRYPDLIEDLVPAMTVCCRDGHREVRQASLLTLIELLQEDYLKPYAPYIFNIWYLVNDGSLARSLVTTYLRNCFLPKHGRDIGRILLRGMFHYNKYEGHPDYKPYELHPRERSIFDCSGVGARQRKLRITVYKTIVGMLNAPFKLMCIDAIIRQILDGVVSGKISVKKPQGASLLQDAFELLSCREIYPDEEDAAGKGSSAGDGNDGDAVAASDAAKKLKKAVPNVFSSQCLPTYSPICIKLYSALFGHNHLRKKFSVFLREMLRDHKESIRDFFAQNQQLGVEILHEINTTKRFAADDEEDEGVFKAPTSPAIRRNSMQRRRSRDSHGRPSPTRPTENAANSPSPPRSDGDPAAPVGNDSPPPEVPDVAAPAPASEPAPIDEDISEASIPKGRFKLVKQKRDKSNRSKQLSVESEPAKANRSEESTDMEGVIEENGDNSAPSGSEEQLMDVEMGPPIEPSRASRSSRRTLRTPVPAVSKKQQKPLMSSTPLVSAPGGSEEQLMDFEMGPPIESSRSSRRTLRTPVPAVSKKQQKPLMSSTPLVTAMANNADNTPAQRGQFNTPEISPVVQQDNSECS